MASAIPPIEVKVQVDTSDITKGLQETKKTVEDFGNTVKAQGTFLERFKASAAGVFAADLAQKGLGMLKASISEVIADAEAYERGLAKVNAVIESTGGVAGVTTEHIRQQSAALESLAAVDENLITQAQGVLLTMTNVRNVMGEGNQIFDRATTAALDLSTVMEGDLQGATVLLGKALQDPIKGMSRLSRVGIDLSSAQETLIKQLMASGDVLGAQKVILKAVEDRYGGAAKAAGDTFAGAVARAKDKASDFARDLVLNMQPILLKVGKTIGDLINKYIAPLVNWLVKNKEVILAMATAVGVMVTALYAYRAVMVITKVASEAFAVAQALMKGVQLASIASTNGLAASTLALNAAMRANPIGLVVTAVTLLIGGFVLLWNKSETFRKGVIAVGKAGLMAFASIIPIVGKVGEALLKFIFTPLKAVLSALSHLPGVGKYAKAGLDILNKGLEGVSDFADKASAKAKELAGNLDKLNKPIKIGGGKTDTGKGKGKGGSTDYGVTDAATEAAKAAAEKEKERLDKLAEYQKDVEGIYKDMNSVIAEAQEKAAEALEARNERMADAHERYNETVADLNKRYNEAIADAEERAAEARSDAQDRYQKAETEARKRYTQAQIDITKKYTAKVADLEKALQTKLSDIREAAEKKRADLAERAAEKQAGIVKQSMDRLRSAFASKTGFDLGEAMAGGKSADALLADLKTKLQAAKDLQANAAALAGMGYSQTFIEEVVKNGPEAGNKIAEALKAASPDATRELQLLYGQVENVSEHGLDALAKTMNAGGKLATSELMEAYTQVATDLRESLTEVDRQMQEGLAEANAAYASAMLEAKAERDAAMTEAMTQMTESIAEAKATLDAALAEAEKTLAKARAEAQKRLNEGLAEAQKTLQKALEDAQKSYEKAIDEINKSTQKKLDELKAKLQEVAAAMAALQAAQAAAAALANAPVYTPIPYVGGGSGGSSSSSKAKSGTTTNVTQNFTSTKVDDEVVTRATLNAIRFGNVIVPTAPSKLAAGESGAIGAASIASRTVTVSTANPVRAYGRGAVAD